MEIVKVEQLTHEKWLNLFAATYRNADREGRWVFASRKQKPYEEKPTADAVVIVPLLRTPDQTPRLVVVKEYRVPIGDYVYGFPAGLRDEDETIEETVRRETLEETGFEVTQFTRITGPLFSSSGLTDEAAAMVFVDVHATPEAKQQLAGMEDIEVLLLNYEQVCELCENTTALIDAKAWNMLYMYQQLGKLA